MEIERELLSKNHPNMTIQQIDSTLGFLPNWLCNMDFLDFNAKDALERQYGFGSLHKFEETKIDENGVWFYPGDPPMLPLSKVTRGEETIYQYLYGLVAIVDKDGNSFCTRMD